MSGWNLAVNGAIALFAHPLLLRLAIASVELAVLATVAWIALAMIRPRSPRLRSLIWLIVLAKPVLSLATGNPWSVVRLPAVAGEEEAEQTNEAHWRRDSAPAPLTDSTNRNSNVDFAPTGTR